jgi:DNA-binding IclR family transcriptional regulator
VRKTDSTICSPERLQSELEEIRKSGIALDRGEHEEGIWCIAVTVMDYAGDAVCAISITDLERRIAKSSEPYARYLRKAAAAISARLGNPGNVEMSRCEKAD